MTSNNLSKILSSFFLLSFFIFLPETEAQSPSKIKKGADKLFKELQYETALAAYLNIKDHYIKNIPLKAQIGQCYFYTEQYSKSIEYLEFYLDNIKKPEKESYRLLAKAYHLLHNFEKAAFYYKEQLQTLSKNDPQRTALKAVILQCMGGAAVANKASGAIVSNLGPSINSKSNDYRAIFHPLQPDQLYFTSDRDLVANSALKIPSKHNQNIYRSSMRQGNWENVQPLSGRYNTSINESIISFFDAGYQLLVLKRFDDGHTEIVKDNFDQDSSDVLLPFALGASSDDWDSDHFFVNDSLILFSSNRSGGYGGKDLYFSIKNDSLGWLTAINMGPQINSYDDDISPFLSKDGRFLYFSSNRKESMGGYDIFKTVFVDSLASWTFPENIGAPLNTAADERDFMLSTDIQKAYFSSNRPKGLGGYDLYAAYFRKKLPSSNSPSTIAFIESNTKIPNNPLPSSSSEQTSISSNSSTVNNTSKELLKSYSISPIYYDQESGRISGARNTLQSLTKVLLQYPQTKVILSAHTDHSGDKITDLYLSVKQAESLGRQLIEEGARNQQIILRGCGQNYPIANYQNFDGTDNPISSKLNRRIEAKVQQINLYPLLEIQYKRPEISSVMQNKTAENYIERRQGLSYRLQITATPGIYSHSILEQFEHAVTEKSPTDLSVKYLLGLEKKLKNIEHLQQQLYAIGFKETKIVPYVNDLPLDDKEVLKWTEIYPDLKQYLQR